MRNPHVHTIWASKLRRAPRLAYERVRIDTPDGDFLDVDLVSGVLAGSPAAGPATPRGVVIVSHGLGGSSSRRYVRGMARAFNAAGWDAAAWNMRGCSGEPNRKLHSYHSGATHDLDTVVGWCRSRLQPTQIVLVGFSLGGNLTLKYLGERGSEVAGLISKAVVWSVPCELGDSAEALARPGGALYMRYLLANLREEVRRKQAMFPGQIDDDGYESIRTFHAFDDRYTAPLNGFRSAEHYWTACSSRQFIAGIRVPTLIVNACDDPFLDGACYPVSEASANPLVALETPLEGGHVGFANGLGGAGSGAGDSLDLYWSERRTIAFVDDE